MAVKRVLRWVSLDVFSGMSVGAETEGSMQTQFFQVDIGEGKWGKRIKSFCKTEAELMGIGVYRREWREKGLID